LQDTTIAVISVKSRPGEPEVNFENHVEWAEKARKEGAELLLFPEMGITGYWTNTNLWKAAEPIPGKSTRQLKTLAERLGVFISAGLAEKDNDIVFDTQILVGPNGYIGKSRKLHIPVPEYGYWRHGYEFAVFDIGKCKVGVNICFDNWLPESSRVLTLKGAEVLLSPWVMQSGKWKTPEEAKACNITWKERVGRIFPSRAFDNGLFIAVVNECGPVVEKGFEYYGQPICLVYDPDGHLIAQSDDAALEETMIIATLKAEALEAARSRVYFHPKFRRPEIYGELTKFC